MNRRIFQLIALFFTVFFTNNTFSNCISDTLKLYEDDKIKVFDYGHGNIEIKHKNGIKLQNTDYKYQVRKFYNRPIFLGSKSKTNVSKIGLSELINSYLKRATIYQNEHYFNDLSVDDSQIKIIHIVEGKIIKFYYVKAYYIYACENGTFKNFWCDEVRTNYSFVEVNINGKEIYFKKIKSK